MGDWQERVFVDAVNDQNPKTTLELVCQRISGSKGPIKIPENLARPTLNFPAILGFLRNPQKSFEDCHTKTINTFEFSISFMHKRRPHDEAFKNIFFSFLLHAGGSLAFSRVFNLDAKSRIFQALKN